MPNTTMTTRQKRVRRHNVATLVALLTFLAIALQSFSDIDLQPAANAFVVIAMFIAVLVMFFTRNADEYVAAIWRSGTSVAFVLTAAVVLFTPFFEGMYDGFVGNPRGQETDLSSIMSLVVIGSFFLANGWARLRGTV